MSRKWLPDMDKGVVTTLLVGLLACSILWVALIAVTMKTSGVV
ncbi:MAG: hypothetical protein QME49_00625 [bacterium]|nr:hypothetical protein [bacterium]